MTSIHDLEKLIDGSVDKRSDLLSISKQIVDNRNDLHYAYPYALKTFLVKFAALVLASESDGVESSELVLK
jgi:hypothetical protein